MSKTILARPLNVTLVNLASRAYVARRQYPFAVQILGGYLRSKSAPAQIKILDMQQELDSCTQVRNSDNRFNRGLSSLIKKLVATHPQIIGLSMKWGTVEPASRIIAEFKNLPEPPLIVLGNNIPTFAGRELLQKQEFSGVCVVEGEGEESLLKIIKKASRSLRFNDLQLYGGIPNVRINPKEDIKKENLDLESYPLFDEETAPELFSQEDRIPLESSRGCPWGHCTFCSIREFYGSPVWRPFSVDLVLDRIERFIRLNKGNIFYFVDTEFFGGMKDEKFENSMERAEKIAKGIMTLNTRYHLHSKNDIQISNFSARVDTIFKEGETDKNKRRLEIYKLLKRAGFKKVYLGVESGSPTQLKRYGKGITVTENKEAIQILKKVGIDFELGFIFFDPLATLKELKENLDFIGKIELTKTNSRMFGPLRIQAGSPIARSLIKKGLVLPDLDLDSASYSLQYYNDPKTGEINKISEIWESQTKELINYMSIFLYRIGRYNQYPEPRHFLDELRHMDFVFLKDYASATPEDRKNVILKHAQELSGTLGRIKDALARGEIKDPKNRLRKEILPEAIRKNKKILELE